MLEMEIEIETLRAIITELQGELHVAKTNAYDEGYSEGYTNGYDDGRADERRDYEAYTLG